MDVSNISKFLLDTLEIFAALFIVTLVIGTIVVVVLFFVDRTQTAHAVRRNYPVIGRFRYLFEHIGEFFRQYFFAMDREELPFNRAQRSWCYRAAKNVDNTTAFGSTRDLRVNGSVIFVNCPYPTLTEDAVEPKIVRIGQGCASPYSTTSLINISAMSYGAISKPAVLALSQGAKMAGCWMNTGEGGLSEYHLAGGGDIVFQMGTAKNGVRDLQGNISDEKLREVAGHEQVKMFEIKLSQGAKPGKGGILPGTKVTAEIAGIRNIEQGKDAISPNRHPDIDCNEQLLDMVDRIRKVTGKPVGLKFVLGAYGWLDSLFCEINRRGIESAPDFISLDSADGGSGAAPLSLMDDMGLPLRESLPLLVDGLVKHRLRERIKIVASGKLVTPADVAWALCVGADFIASARGFMFALGCIQALQCNKNTCPTGITTHDKGLQRGLVPEDKSVRVANYCRNLQHEVGTIAHSCGVPEPRGLRRSHARIISDNGISLPLNELYPEYPAGHV
ncbi:MAG: glutamate synthase domain-containing protein 2 [Gammaproteobacteria bacterium]|jgi:glutamate synthase domain-containing protein 2